MTFDTYLTEHDLGKWGKCRFIQWAHPDEGRKEFSERDIDWLAQFIPPGSTVIDVGAYTGDTAFPMAVAAGKNGLVIAFEPNPVTSEILRRNAVLNPGIADIVHFPFAVGCEAKEDTFFYDPPEMNGGALVEGEPLRVKIRTFDDLVACREVQYVKFDCEGQDGLLLEHYFAWLRQRKSVVCVERFPFLTDVASAHLWKAITAYGEPFLEGDWNRNRLASLPVGLWNIVITPLYD